MRVTFDTNAIDRAVCPEVLEQAQQHPGYLKIQQALKSGRIRGFFCETIVTLEGVQNADRVDVFGGTKITSQRTDASGPHEAEALTLEVSQPDRRKLHPRSQERIRAALRIGMRAMHMPRIGAFTINDPEKEFFVDDPEATWKLRIDRAHALSLEIEQRGAGFAQVKAVARKFSTRDNAVGEPWFKSLLRAQDERQKNEVNKAVAEWADGDAVAAHYGYDFDLFCTEDKAKNAGGASVMSAANRSWLETQYGLKFVTLSELAAKL